jgi:hypothetical protein
MRPSLKPITKITTKDVYSLGMHKAAQLLASSPIDTLELEEINLTDSDVDSLAKSLSRNKTLLHFKLYNVKMGLDKLFSIVNALYKNTAPQLKTFYYEAEIYREIEGQALAKMLKTALQLEDLRIAPNGHYHINESVKFLLQHTSLKKINFDGGYIDNDEFLGRKTGLISITNLQLTQQGLTQLPDILNNNQGLQELRVSNNNPVTKIFAREKLIPAFTKLQNLTSVEIICLEICSLDLHRPFLKAAVQLTTLEEIIINGGILNSEDVGNLGSVIDNNPKLKTLNFASCELSEGAWPTFFSALSGATKLTTLNLQNFNVHDNDVEMFVNSELTFLKNLTSLENLDLSSDLDQEISCSLSRAILGVKDLPRLKDLKLVNNIAILGSDVKLDIENTIAKVGTFFTLKSLELSGANFALPGVSLYVAMELKGLPNLSNLTLSYLEPNTYNLLLDNVPSLTFLEVSSGGIEDNSSRHPSLLKTAYYVNKLRLSKSFDELYKYLNNEIPVLHSAFTMIKSFHRLHEEEPFFNQLLKEWADEKKNDPNALYKVAQYIESGYKNPDEVFKLRGVCKELSKQSVPHQNGVKVVLGEEHGVVHISYSPALSEEMHLSDLPAEVLAHVVDYL